MTNKEKRISELEFKIKLHKDLDNFSIVEMLKSQLKHLTTKNK